MANAPFDLSHQEFSSTAVSTVNDKQGESIMDVIYSSAHFWILAYPAQQGFELFDKETLSNVYLQGPLATHFRQAMEDIPSELRDEETIDAFLDDYCSGSARPIVFH